MEKRSTFAGTTSRRECLQLGAAIVFQLAMNR
jgi:hypothetical protein